VENTLEETKEETKENAKDKENALDFFDFGDVQKAPT